MKFVVVIHKRATLSDQQFFRYFREVHGPLAGRLPGLQRYVQNFATPDASRKPPSWSAVIELYFADQASMEAAWQSPEGKAATEDLKHFADLERTTWSIVQEHCVLP